MIREWRVWYKNGEVLSSTEMAWKDLPYDDVQFVKIKEEEQYLPGLHYCRILNGKDWYWMDDDGEIHGSMSVGWDGWIPKPSGVPDHMIKRGTGMDLELFNQMNKEVDATWR